jgi:thiol-disulfide isomerase/thioredoxin
MLRALAPLLVSGCIPHLYSSDGDDSEPTGWTLPENTWKSCGTPGAQWYEEPTGYDVGERFPDARLIDQHGETVSMWQFTDCVTIIDLSTGWCAPCQQLARGVDELYAEYEAQGVMYVTLLSQGVTNPSADLSDVQAWSSNYGVVDTPVLVDPSDPEKGLESHTEQITTSFPRIVSLDRDMRVANDNIGAGDAETTEKLIRAEIERLLAE